MNPSVFPLMAARAELLAMVGGSNAPRIYPVTADQDTLRPYIVWAPVGISSEQYFACPDDVDYDRVQIDCWADTYPDAQELIKQCRLALSGHGYLISGFNDYESDTRLYRASMDWSFVTL